MKEIFRKEGFPRKASYAVFALCPVAAIAVFFLQKILAMKQFVFGDDIGILQWFHKGRIAFTFWEGAKDGIEGGRFYPLGNQEYNLISLLNPELSLCNLAERCFYVQAGMWILVCTVFFILMICIAKMEKARIQPVLWLFIPLSLLALLYTPAFVSYFTMLIFLEKHLCVLFLLFFLFYYLAIKRDKAIWYFLAWLSAAIALYGKENVLTIFAVICGVQFLFGWRELTRKHKIFLFSLPVNIGIYLLMYYFLVYRNMIKAYNAEQCWDKVFWENVGRIFCTYPVWGFAFLLGIYRLIRVVFYRERKHLFMDAMLFAILGFFLSYLILKLTNWWYWGVGAVVVMPVFFYWLIVCEKWWCRTALFLAAALCFAISVKPAYERMNRTFLAQQQDPLFLKKVDRVKAGKRILFPAFSQNIIENACYQYLKIFLEKLGTPGKWQTKFIPFRDFPEQLTPEDVCVVWQGAVRHPDLQKRLYMSGFQSIAVCYFYEAFAYDSGLDGMWEKIPADSPVPAKSPFCLFGTGWAAPEEWGRWSEGREAEAAVAVPPRFRKKNLKLTLDVYTFVHPKKPVCRFNVRAGSRILKEVESKEFISRFSVNIPAELTAEARLLLKFENSDPRSPKELGISADPRKLGVGLCRIAFEEAK